MADREPVVLNGRYELHSRIARGGMAEVFLARDQLLDRQVAVKVLFSEFAADPAFVERFRREAQAAANLNHQNIVGVYDWGSFEGTYFIVMEYVRGRSLADILRAEGRLHPDRAADIAADIASALYFAHRNGVVHRDVKPGNVLITTQGQVKVTDFGIARAIGGGNTDNLTQTGSVMGTATYFSPEQAQGLPVDPRSDLYSLGVLLYEMLVGRPPFSGDSPVAIAYQHVQKTPTPPRQIEPQIPVPLEAITLKLLAKNPANRYATAEELRADLRRFRTGQPVAAESVLAPPVAAVGARPVPGPADATAMIASTQALARQPGADPTRVVAPVYQGAPVYEPPRKHTGVFIAVVVLLLAALVALLVLFAREVTDKSDDGGTTVAVPAVVNQTRQQAEAALTAAGLQAEVTVEANTTVAANVVFAQDPAAGVDVKKDSAVKLKVNTSVQAIALPSLVGQKEEDAKNVLRAAGFERIEVQRQRETDVKKQGIVLAQNPAPGTQGSKDTTVSLTVGAAPDVITLPNVAGQTVEVATEALVNAGVNRDSITTVEAPSPTVAAGQVIATIPTGTVAPGAGVQLQVSTGPQQVSVPDVVNNSQSAAEQLVINAGLVPRTTTRELKPGESGAGNVIDQTPEGGQKVDPGSQVGLVVGVAPSTTTTAPPSTTTTTSRGTTTSTTNPDGN